MSESSTEVLGLRADAGRSGATVSGALSRAPLAKLVVYRKGSATDGAQIQVFESFADMRERIPDDILEQAEIAARVRTRDHYPEEPLEL